MFCYHCGKPVPEGSAFCAHCGSAVTPPTAPPPTPPLASQPIPAKKANKGWLIAVLAGLAAVAVILAVLWSTGAFDSSGGGGGGGSKTAKVANDPESVAEAFVEAYILDDYRAQFDLLAWDHENCFEDSYHPNRSFYSNEKKQAKADLEAHYGDYDLVITTTNMSELSSYNLRECVNKMEQYFGDYLDEGIADTIEEGYLVTVKSEFIGEKRTEYATHSLVVVNCDGAWRVTDGQCRYGLATDDYFAFFYGYT